MSQTPNKDHDAISQRPGGVDGSHRDDDDDDDDDNDMQSDAITTDNSPLMDPTWIANAYENNSFWLSSDAAADPSNNGIVNGRPLRGSQNVDNNLQEQNEPRHSLSFYNGTTTTDNVTTELPSIHPLNTAQHTIVQGDGQYHSTRYDNVEPMLLAHHGQHQPTFSSTQQQSLRLPLELAAQQQALYMPLSVPKEISVQRRLDSTSLANAVTGAIAATSVPSESNPSSPSRYGLSMDHPRWSSQPMSYTTVASTDVSASNEQQQPLFGSMIPYPLNTGHAALSPSQNIAPSFTGHPSYHPPLFQSTTPDHLAQLRDFMMYSYQTLLNPMVADSSHDALNSAAFQRYPVAALGEVSYAANHASGTSTARRNEAGNNIVDSGNQPPMLRPVKPLSPYNYYYRFERKRILKYWPMNEGEQDRKLPADYYDHYSLNVSNSEDFQQQLLQEQWSRPPDAKRQHRKSHGLISFRDLSKRIARNWHNLPSAAKDVFRAISKKDHERHMNEMEKYNNQRQR